jgi:hypothetical protein
MMSSKKANKQPIVDDDMKDLVDDFSWAMLEKMRRNAEKKGNSWEGMHETEIYDMLRREIDELEDSWNRGGRLDIIDELIDVANFCMMLRDRLIP